jgi:site-specific DNA-cytosine methylase
MAMGGKNERGYRIGIEEASAGFIIPTVAPTLQASQSIAEHPQQAAYVVSAPLTRGSASGEGVNPPGRRQEDDVNLVAFSHTQGLDAQPSESVWPSLRREGGGQAVGDGAAVRRLTPVECERLQGFPDNWTRLDEKTPDSRRYAALGDAVTVPVAAWIGRRLA